MSSDVHTSRTSLNFSDKGVAVIATDHRHLHDGTSFHASGQTTKNNGQTYVLHLITPSSGEVHLVWQVRASGEANVKFYETPTKTNNGTTLATSVVNRNRGSSTATTLALYHTPTTSNVGTLLTQQHFGSGRTPGVARGASEWELKASTSYLLILTSEAASNDISWMLDWYEEA